MNIATIQNMSNSELINYMSSDYDDDPLAVELTGRIQVLDKESRAVDYLMRSLLDVKEFEDFDSDLQGVEDFIIHLLKRNHKAKEIITEINDFMSGDLKELIGDYGSLK